MRLSKHTTVNVPYRAAFNMKAWEIERAKPINRLPNDNRTHPHYWDEDDDSVPW